MLLCCWPLLLAAEELSSPGGQTTLRFYIDQGLLTYELHYKGQPVLRPSHLGLELVNWPSLMDGFSLVKTERSTFDETWQPVWGEERAIRNHYNELAAEVVQERTQRHITLRFRVYDEGIGLRYELPRQEQLDNVIVGEEHTQFALTGDHTAFWLPGDYDTDEYEYTVSRLSEVRQLQEQARTENATQRGFSSTGLQTSLLLKTDGGLYINIHEAALVDYSCMHLNLDDEHMVLESWLTPDAKGRKGFIRCPTHTPWRTVMVTDDAREMLASRLILNLNEPCKLADTSWIHPTKYMGVWWEMMTGKSTWNYADYQAVNPDTTDFARLTPTGRHGASRENVMRYIDYASEHGFPALLVEGWNCGWEDSWQKYNNYSFTRPYPDFPVQELQSYARSKGVRLIMHHETSGSVAHYERYMDEAYAFAHDNGYDLIKTGYVGNIFPSGHHGDQWMVDHFLYSVQLGAKYHLMIDGHEAVRPTGLCRTYPNLVCNESARGMEFQASAGVQPRHVTILPFTRLQGGPMDYTPGILEMDVSKVNPENHSRVKATVCNQLALYVTLYSPLQMAADVPESYERYSDAFQFIKDVAVDWEESRYLEAEPGEYVTVARKAKGSDEWFMGSVAGSKAHESVITLDFLQPGIQYTATLYEDGKDASWQERPDSYSIRTKKVKKGSRLRLRAVEGGGWAIRITPMVKR